MTSSIKSIFRSRRGKVVRRTSPILSLTRPGTPNLEERTAIVSPPDPAIYEAPSPIAAPQSREAAAVATDTPQPTCPSPQAQTFIDIPVRTAEPEGMHDHRSVEESRTLASATVPNSFEIEKNAREANVGAFSSARDESQKDEAIVDALLDVYRREPGPLHVLDFTTDKMAKQVVTALSNSDDQLSNVTAEQAQSTLDFLQDLLDIQGLPLSYKHAFIKTSLKLSRMYDCVPRCIMPRGFKEKGDHPFALGQFGEVWRGEVGGTEVAIKRARIFDIKQVLRKMTREAIIWGQCDHPNVLPFYGIYRDSASPSICLVSPFMSKGDLCCYLSNTANPDRHRLGLDITRGMGYLHKMSIVHGDLKGDNILITDDDRAVIADFGISFAMDAMSLPIDSPPSVCDESTIKHQAPEVLEGNPPNFSADVYSLACVYFEVFHGSMPWSGLNIGTIIVTIFVRKEHPPRPKYLSETIFPDLWWELMVRGWAHEPSDRPTLQDLMESLHVTDNILPPPKWDKSVLAELRGPLDQIKSDKLSDLPPFLGALSTLLGEQSLNASTSPPKVSTFSPSPGMEYTASAYNSVRFGPNSLEVGQNTREANVDTLSSAGDEYQKDEAIVDTLLDAYRQEPRPWHVLDATTTDKTAMHIMTVLSKPDIHAQLSDLTEIQAQSTLDFLQDLLDIQGLPLSYRSTFLKASLKLSRTYDCVPRYLILTCLEKKGDYPFDRGHYGDLWRGEVKGTEVAVKQARIFTIDNNIKKVLRKMTREAIIWGQCDHPNVLPFFGIYRDSASPSVCLVSPFMAKGNLRYYLNKNANPDRHRLGLDITRGMGYLHKMSIVHGDLKGDNILITDDDRAVIADFGISFVMSAVTFGTSSSSRKGGAVRWQAPEVLNGNSNSFSADVYSLACVYFEVFDGSMPWSDLLIDSAVILNVCVHKKHLPCPRYLPETDLWWDLMVQCWAHQPPDRPTLQYLMESLHATDDTPTSVMKWDKSILTRLRDPLVQGKSIVPSGLPSFLNVEGVSYSSDIDPISVAENFDL